MTTKELTDKKMERLRQVLEIQQEDIEERNGLSYCKNCGLSGKDLLDKIDAVTKTTPSQEDTKEAVWDFNCWLKRYKDADRDLFELVWDMYQQSKEVK